MNFETLFSSIIIAILSIFGNILFFRYEFKKRHKLDVLQQQLTEFLLPLFYAFKDRQLKSLEWSDMDNYDYIEDETTKPKELLKEIVPIIKNKMYLADNELHLCCIDFLKWAVTFDENKAFQESFQK